MICSEKNNKNLFVSKPVTDCSVCVLVLMPVGRIIATGIKANAEIVHKYIR